MPRTACVSPSEVAKGQGATVTLQIAIDAAGKVAGVTVVGSADLAMERVSVWATPTVTVFEFAVTGV